MPSVFPPGVRLGSRYRVLRVVARGPLAALYEAQDFENGEAVAFKWLHPPEPRVLARLAARAEAAQQLHHPYVARVFEVVREDNSLFVVGEWLGGDPYSHFLAHHMLRLEVRLAVLSAAMHAVAAGHRVGIAHCGLHPDNLLIAAQGGDAPQVKLLDFALNQSCCAAMLGTPERVLAGHHVYMAPEQLEPDCIPNARSDIYAAAVLTYQALTGRLPFPAETPAALATLFASSSDPPLASALRADVPHELSIALAACFARRPEQRPAQLDTLTAQLEAFAHGVTLREGDVGMPRRPRGPLPVTDTQSLTRGKLTGPDSTPEPDETDSVSQPISHHGFGEAPPANADNRALTRWMAASALAACALLFAAGAWLLPASSVRRGSSLPPPLPAEQAPAPLTDPVAQPARPTAALPSQRQARAALPKRKRENARPNQAASPGSAADAAPADDAYRAGRPLTREDF
jgi:eukaryotic-like serine/threonine-protein kinase